MKILALGLLSSLTFGAMSCEVPSKGHAQQSQIPIDFFDGEDSCNAQATADQLTSDPNYLHELKNQAQSDQNIRIIYPNTAVTMDASPDRLNIYLDDNDQVTRLGCI